LPLDSISILSDTSSLSPLGLEKLVLLDVLLDCLVHYLKKDMMKTYLDPVRIAKIKSFALLVVEQKLQPYYALIEENICSVPLLVEAYHDFIYKQYFQVSKAERYNSFCSRLHHLLDVNPPLAGTYIMRTALLEGAVPKPNFSLTQGLQLPWANLVTCSPLGVDLLFRYWEPLYSYFQEPDDGSMNNTHRCIGSHLAFLRNKIVRSISKDEAFVNWRDRFSLWYELLHYDQSEVDHLASLDYANFLDSDYWRTFGRHFKSERRYRCSHCGSSKYPQIHHLSYDFRGQEIIFPHSVICLCSLCHQQAHDLID
jgi:hypothetical protein